MPLAFQSLSHGQIAFGFFNIETDMLLLDIYFFFADDFCRVVGEFARGRSEAAVSASLDAYTLVRNRIGNLMGSIHGIDFSGFIGDVYRLYPFPREEDEFRQQPEGSRNRGKIEDIIQKYARSRPIMVMFDPVRGIVDIGGYVFDRREFLRLVEYVWMGGYPRWRDGMWPEYVTEMKRTIEGSENPVFTGINLDKE